MTISHGGRIGCKDGRVKAPTIPQSHREARSGGPFLFFAGTLGQLFGLCSIGYSAPMHPPFFRIGIRCDLH